MTTAAQPITTTPAPSPLPDQWARAIANSISTELRRGWRTTTTRSSMHPTGNPRTGGHSTARSFPPPEMLPSSYVETQKTYAHQLIYPHPEIGNLYLAWELNQLHLAEALAAANLLEHHRLVNQWLHATKAEPFRIAENRHGTICYRRNSEYAPEDVALVMLTAAHAAEVVIPDKEQTEDYLAEHDPISLLGLLGTLRQQTGVSLC